ncbi:MAG: DUF1697 domain-containing protein [Christensenellales bacterium]
MTTFAALLRGINVGGNNIIKMAALKRLFEAAGCSRVQTYIQSGNVLFQSDEEEEQLRAHMESELEKAFGLKITVVLRTAAQLESILQHCPFSREEVLAAESAAIGESLYVSLLARAPLPEGIGRLNAYKSENEKVVILGREVYLLFYRSIRDSNLANNLQKLAVPFTVRNWKTLAKLCALAKAMEV